MTHASLDSALQTPTIDRLVEQLPAAVAVLDGNRRLRCVSGALAAKLKYDPASLHATDWLRVVHSHHRGTDHAEWDALTSTARTAYQVQQRLCRADGTEMWARLSFAAVDADGATADPHDLMQLLVVEDISELRVAQHAARERRKELGALRALAHRIMEPSDLGSPGWLEGVVNLIPPAFQWPAHTEACVQLGAFAARTEGHRRSDTRFAPRLRVRWRDAQGAECFLEALYTGPETSAPFLAEERSLLESLADLLRVAVHSAEQRIARDRIERALASSETHLEMALAAVRMGIVDWDLTSDELQLSDSACQMFGLDPREGRFGVQEMQECVHPEDREMLWGRFRSERRAGAVGVHEYRVLHRDGSTRWISARGRFFCDADGKPLRRLSVIVDVTERRSLEDQCRQAQKMEAMGQLAGGIAHDFNNLLTILRTVGELAQSSVDPAHPVRKDLDEILTAVDRGTALARQLLTFSRRDVVQRLRVDLGTVLRQMAPILRRVSGPTVSLSITGDSAPLVVFADPRQLEQVILNLVVNARDALVEGGQIDVSTRYCELDDAAVAVRPGLDTGRYAMLTVSDNGIGMDAATQARVFEPFFTTKDAQHGTGLGLSSVFGIVKQADGHVGLYSEPGEGATFRVYLPLTGADDVDAWETPREVSALPAGDETVLVVDDEPLLRQVTQRILGSLGYRVLQASDGREALQMIHTFDGPIHLLLCDIALPGHDGRSVSDAMHLSRPEVPTLFMSGYSADVMGERLSLDPGVRFLEKPFTRQSLARLVRTTIDQVPTS